MEYVAIIIAALGVAVSALATIIATRTQKKQMELTKELHDDARLLAQRRAFIDIWPLIANMRDIDIQKVYPAVVIENTNKLELIAACWEGQMVDLDLIRRTFQSRYIEMVEKIQSVPPMSELNGKDGRTVLRENPSVERLYARLKQESLDEGAVKGLKETIKQNKSS